MKPEVYQIVREIVSGTVLILVLYLFWSFISVLHLSDWKRRNQSSWVRAAIALSTAFLGLVILRAWDYALALGTNLNIRYDWPPAELLLAITKKSWVALLIGGAVFMVGGLCCVRVFSPKKRAGVFKVVAAVAILLPLAIHLYFHGW